MPARGLAYARKLGFNPHEDYAPARQLFGDVLAADGAKTFSYGHDGKPFYVSGPHDTPEQVEHDLQQLEERVGQGNFDFLVGEPL